MSSQEEIKIHGYWADHPYKRHSVQEIDEFVGWGKLLKMCDKADTINNRGLVSTLFSTGCRISECLQLKISNFDLLNDKYVRCVKVPIVKQKKMGPNPTRTFSFPKDEPLYRYVKENILIRQRTRSRYYKDPLLFPIHRTTAYRIVRDLGAQCGLTVWAHWFRSQRASQIGLEYEFTENELMEWFKVKDREWARRYCKKGDYGLRKIMEKRKPLEWRM